MREILTSYQWPNEGFPFAGVRMRVDELASRLGVDLQQWDSNGLGPASGFGFRSESGRVYLVEELEEGIKFYGAMGPDVYADAADLANIGAQALVDDVIRSLALSYSDVAMSGDAPAVEKMAAEFVARCDAARARKSRS